MPQYDVYPNPSSRSAEGMPYVVVIQSDLLDALPRSEAPEAQEPPRPMDEDTRARLRAFTIDRIQQNLPVSEDEAATIVRLFLHGAKPVSRRGRAS